MRYEVCSLVSAIKEREKLNCSEYHPSRQGADFGGLWSLHNHEQHNYNCVISSASSATP
jgi:hypothetical protein